MAVLAFDTLRSQRYFTTRRFAFMVGQERVVVRGWWAGAFCESEHHNEIEMKVDSNTRGADNTPSPMPPTRPRADSSSS